MVCGAVAIFDGTNVHSCKELGVDCIDIIVLCRVPQDVPIEETVKAMQQMVTEGKAKHIGLSEVGGWVVVEVVGGRGQAGE
jgi:aryl-alcohol dehydrogenase-like predicted oxidoreductase